MYLGAGPRNIILGISFYPDKLKKEIIHKIIIRRHDLSRPESSLIRGCATGEVFRKKYHTFDFR